MQELQRVKHTIRSAKAPDFKHWSPEEQRENGRTDFKSNENLTVISFRTQMKDNRCIYALC